MTELNGIALLISLSFVRAAPRGEVSHLPAVSRGPQSDEALFAAQVRDTQNTLICIIIPFRDILKFDLFSLICIFSQLNLLFSYLYNLIFKLL